MVRDCALCGVGADSDAPRKPKDGDNEDSRVEVAKEDISSLTWATIGKSQQFRVHRYDGVEDRQRTRFNLLVAATHSFVADSTDSPAAITTAWLTFASSRWVLKLKTFL